MGGVIDAKRLTMLVTIHFKYTAKMSTVSMTERYDGEGLGLNEAFHYMQTVKASIFIFNKTQGNNKNPKTRKF